MKMIYSYSTIVFCRKIRTLFQHYQGSKKENPYYQRDNQESKKRDCQSNAILQEELFSHREQSRIIGYSCIKIDISFHGIMIGKI